MRGKFKLGAFRWMKGQMLKRMHGMITCREFEEFIISYIEGELTPKQSRVFTMHLRICRECREYLNAYKRTMEINNTLMKKTTELKQEDIPQDLQNAILAAIQTKD